MIFQFTSISTAVFVGGSVCTTEGVLSTIDAALKKNTMFLIKKLKFFFDNYQYDPLPPLTHLLTTGIGAGAGAGTGTGAGALNKLKNQGVINSHLQLIFKK